VPEVLLEMEQRGRSGQVARLTLDNQAKLNVINKTLIAELSAAVRKLQNHDDLRVLILTGAGPRSFIGGVDLKAMQDLNPASAREFITRLHELCAALRELPVPVIARINGYCFGGGLEVAASCDLRVAAEHATFGMPEVRFGVPSVIEAALLPGLCGWGKTREIIYTGLPLTAGQALACGLVDKVVPPDKLDAAIQEWVEAICQAEPRAIRLQKSLLRQWERLPLDQAIAAGIDSFGQAFATDAPRRLMRGFFADRRAKSDPSP